MLLIAAPAWIPDEPPTLETLLVWSSQPAPVLPVLSVILAAFYCKGVRRMRARGRHWPWRRTVSFLSGCAVLIAITGTGIEGYGYKLFSAWMFQHLTLSMTIPPLLVLGSPVRLLLRTARHHGLGRISLIVVLTALRSRLARLVLHPAAMIPVFLFSYYGIYLTPVLETVGSNWPGHVGLETFFLVSGLLFIIPILSTGPLPGRPSNLGRLADIFVELSLHPFFAVILMMASSPMIGIFADPPPNWGIDPASDQYLAGALAWSYGEPVALLIVVIFAIRWNRDERRKSLLDERRKDREGDLELEAYNRYLKQLNG